MDIHIQVIPIHTLITTHTVIVPITNQLGSQQRGTTTIQLPTTIMVTTTIIQVGMGDTTTEIIGTTIGMTETTIEQVTMKAITTEIGKIVTTTTHAHRVDTGMEIVAKNLVMEQFETDDLIAIEDTCSTITTIDV